MVNPSCPQCGHPMEQTGESITSYNPYDKSTETGNMYKCPKCGKHRVADIQRKERCYIATCVYGSYDCPEVWTLRRYRDIKLKQSPLGRQLIRLYYIVGSKLVRVLGNKKWFRKLWKPLLDAIIYKLKSNGVDNSPYSDDNV